MNESNVIIEKATIDDAQEILALQKFAYQTEANLYGGYPIPPLVESLDDLKKNFESHIFLKAMVEGKIVGSVRVLEKDGTCHVARLMVHPDWQNRGIGAKLLREVERVLPACRRFELFTGTKSEKNIRLYEKAGYRAFKVEKPTDNVELVFLEKAR
jgi:ribosomal protein S18 acetylase RimI-like enzyme